MDILSIFLDNFKKLLGFLILYHFIADSCEKLVIFIVIKILIKFLGPQSSCGSHKRFQRSYMGPAGTFTLKIQKKSLGTWTLDPYY